MMLGIYPFCTQFNGSRKDGYCLLALKTGEENDQGHQAIKI